MRSIALTLGALSLPLAAQAALTAYSFGSSFEIGSLSDTSTYEIVSASTTFVPGAAPASSSGEVYLWPGLMTIAGEFIYGSFEKTSPASCSATGSEWCLTAQYDGKHGLISGAYSALTGTAPVTIDWELNQATGNLTTSISSNGSQMSQISVASSHASAFGLANVCIGGCSAATAQQTYTNTKIVLASATPGFGATAIDYAGTSHSGLTTTDGGLTWTIASIVIPAGTASD